VRGLNIVFYNFQQSLNINHGQDSEEIVSIISSGTQLDHSLKLYNTIAIDAIDAEHVTNVQFDRYSNAHDILLV